MVVSKKNKKVLIVKIGALGDVALALSLVKPFEQSQITWLVGLSAQPLIKAVPNISSIITIDEKALLKGNFFQKIGQLFSAWKKLFFKRFDIIVTAHKDPRYHLLSLFCLKKKHCYFQPLDPFPLGDKFHGRAYLDLVSTTFSLQYPKLEVPTSNFEAASFLKKPWIVLNIFGDSTNNRHLRYWDLDSYFELAEILSKNNSVILIGDSKAKELSKTFDSLNILNLVGKTNVEELLYLLHQSYCLITHDSGPLHLGRVARCRLACLFGPTNPKNFSLESEDECLFYSNLACSPCYDGKKFPQCQKNKCLKTISAKLVYETLKKRFTEIF